MSAIRVAIIACGMVLSFLGRPPGTGAQGTAKLPRIGLLVTGPPPGEHACVIAFRRGLTDIGLVEGRTYVLETRWAEGRPEEAFADLALKHQLRRSHLEGEQTGRSAARAIDHLGTGNQSANREGARADHVVE